MAIHQWYIDGKHALRSYVSIDLLAHLTEADNAERRADVKALLSRALSTGETIEYVAREF